MNAASGDSLLVSLIQEFTHFYKFSELAQWFNTTAASCISPAYSGQQPQVEFKLVRIQQPANLESNSLTYTFTGIFAFL